MRLIKKMFLGLILLLVTAAVYYFCAKLGCGIKYTSILQKKSDAKKTHSYSLLIDLDLHKIYLLDGGKPVKSYLCAVGKPETPSPLGFYRITQKSHWGEGFGGYWMGINCPWGNFGIHGTLMPQSIGGNVSHGCFRMLNSQCEELYDTVPLNTPVLVVSGCYGPFGKAFRNLGPGFYGSDVQTVQKRLEQLGYYAGSTNGIFDTPGFLAALHRFQAENGLAVSDWINKKAVEQMGIVIMD